MQFHATVIAARYTSEESHTIFRRPVTGSHYIPATARRRGSVHSGDGACCILASMVGYVKSNDRASTSGRRPLYQQNFCYLAVLSKVIIRTKGWNELIHHVRYVNEKIASSKTDLLFRESRTNPENVDDISLNHTYICKLAPS